MGRRPGICIKGRRRPFPAPFRGSLAGLFLKLNLIPGTTTAPGRDKEQRRLETPAVGNAMFPERWLLDHQKYPPTGLHFLPIYLLLSLFFVVKNNERNALYVQCQLKTVTGNEDYMSYLFYGRWPRGPVRSGGRGLGSRIESRRSPGL